MHGHLGGLPPKVDLAAERALSETLVDTVGLITSAHDLSDGGLAQALVESCLARDIGASVTVGDDAFIDLFAESAARAVVTVPSSDADALLALAQHHGVRIAELGRTGGSSLSVEGVLDVPLQELREAWTATLPAALG